MFALVLPDLGDAAVDRPYTYTIPPALQSQVVVGGRVLAPLHTRQVAGYVIAIESQVDVPADKLRPLLAVKSSTPAFTPEQAALARWLADYYLCPLSEALRPCLAEAGALSARRCWQCVDAAVSGLLLPDPTAQAVIDYLRLHPGAASSQLRGKFGDAGQAAVDALRRDGLIRPVGGAKVKEREVQAVFTPLSPQALQDTASGLPARVAKQALLLQWAAEYLTSDLVLTVPEVARRAGVGDAVVRTCISKGWFCQQAVAVRRNPWEDVQGRKAIRPELTERQRAAVEAITNAIDRHAATSFLLFGVTSSGKTEVFLHAIDAVVARGRQVIVLVPEISLTAQAMALYHGRFPGKVAVLHSNLSLGERFDEWQRIARGEAQVVLGARSAIFAPCPDLGLIVIDEEHESSYKQESNPRYHAKAVALERGRLCGAPVVLASATPSLESMREAELDRHTLLRLPERIADRPLPPVKLVDLKRMTSGARILSAPLRTAIGERLTAGQQVILFLNRRGYSYSLLCAECGHFAVCPNCAVPLTYHKQAKMLRCHHCDHQKRPTAVCPECKGQQIAYRGVGTERLEAEVQALWPQARIGRLDRDTTTRKGSHREILDRFGREETDILIGTQMVAKGFDFPKVTLVGVIASDTSLAISDFRAPERTFQLLTQVAGRAGRAEWAGEVIVQTFQPEHYAIQAAARHDYEDFYRQEIVRRGDSDACWPPLTALVNVLVTGENESEVKATAAALARRAREEGAGTPVLPPMETGAVLPGLLDFLKVDPEPEEDDDPFDAEILLHRDIPEVSVNAPAPCPLTRLRGRYRYHVVLRGQDRTAVRRLARTLREITPPKGVYIVIDVDPLTLA